MKLRALFASIAIPAVGACAHYTDVKEIKMVSFDSDLSKGKPSGQLESDDCVYHVMGYWLGGRPDVSRAIANARTQKKSSITDVAVASAAGGPAVRYVTNVETKYDGFNAGVFGKSCINVRGAGYL